MTKSPLRRADLEFVARNMRPASRAEVFACRENDDIDDLVAEITAFGGEAYCFGLDEPIYVGGFFETEPSRWFSWGFATDRFDEIAIPLTRTVRRGIIEPLLARGPKTIETCGLGGYPDIARWMEFLGAKQVATLHGRGKNGEDVILYRWESSDVLRGR